MLRSSNSRLSRRISAEGRVVADGLTAADLHSDDSGVRYDAMWLIREFSITFAVPALRSLAKRLTGPGQVG
jgi:hypothetical protein